MQEETACDRTKKKVFKEMGILTQIEMREDRDICCFMKEPKQSGSALRRRTH